MKKKKDSHVLSMPMLEMILGIGIFLIISVVVLQLFLSANMLQSKAKDTGKAVIISENIAEAIKGTKNIEVAVQGLSMQMAAAKLEQQSDGSYHFSELNMAPGLSEEAIKQSGQTVIYIVNYDKDWNIVSKEDTYCAILIPSEVEKENGRMLQMGIYVYCLKGYPSLGKRESHILLYHLQAEKYHSEDGGYYE